MASPATFRGKEKGYFSAGKKFLQEYGAFSKNQYINVQALCLLLEYEYPGNIRELILFAINIFRFKR